MFYDIALDDGMCLFSVCPQDTGGLLLRPCRLSIDRDAMHIAMEFRRNMCMATTFHGVSLWSVTREWKEEVSIVIHQVEGQMLLHCSGAVGRLNQKIGDLISKTLFRRARPACFAVHVLDRRVGVKDLNHVRQVIIDRQVYNIKGYMINKSMMDNVNHVNQNVFSSSVLVEMIMSYAAILSKPARQLPTMSSCQCRLCQQLESSSQYVQSRLRRQKVEASMMPQQDIPQAEIVPPVLTGKNWSDDTEDAYDEMWLQVQKHYWSLRDLFVNEQEFIGACVKYTDLFHNQVMKKRLVNKIRNANASTSTPGEITPTEVESPTEPRLPTTLPIVEFNLAAESAAAASSCGVEPMEEDVEDGWIFTTPVGSAKTLGPPCPVNTLKRDFKPENRSSRRTSRSRRLCCSTRMF